jgi:hypothetical protein
MFYLLCFLILWLWGIRAVTYFFHSEAEHFFHQGCAYNGLTPQQAWLRTETDLWPPGYVARVVAAQIYTAWVQGDISLDPYPPRIPCPPEPA